MNQSDPESKLYLLPQTLLMTALKLFMLLLGWRVKGRYTEQHDIFFGIGKSLKDLLPDIVQFLPHAATTMHIDVWREVNNADGHLVNIEVPDETQQHRAATKKNGQHLFFLNLGGYKANEFEEAHYKMLVAANTLDNAKARAKQSFFYKNTGLANSAAVHSAGAHIDDKYGIDVDDAVAVKDILPAAMKEKFRINITASTLLQPDELHIGYLPLTKI
jgi:hypothetical protein